MPTPTIAQQIRAERRRRARRRTAAFVLGLAGAAVLGLRVVAGAAGPDPSGSPTSRTGATTAAPAATTTVAPMTAVPAPPAAGLDPGLVEAFEGARSRAADAGHRLTITSGFRTADEQQALLEEEVRRRGSYEEAQRWVFPPDRSMHVQGLAVDVGDGPAADWLAEEGHRFGICRTLDWEWWHFEWRARWEATGTCPSPARSLGEAPTR